MNQGRLLGLIASLMLISSATEAKTFPSVPNEYVVKLKTSSATLSNKNLESILGAQVKRSVLPDQNLILVQRPSVEVQEYSLQTLNGNPMVEYAEPNYIYTVVGGSKALPNDPELSRLWGLINAGQKSEGDFGDIMGRSGVDISAQGAWLMETGTSEILIAVIDTGVKYDHPDLINNMFINQAELNGQPGVDDDNNGCTDDIRGCDYANNDGDPMDDYGHGTHVSGTIAAEGNNSAGIVGVAWNVKVLPIKFLAANGSGTLENAIKSIDYATKMNVKMMNNSWGGGGFSQALLDSVVRAKEAGILFLAAAGNDGSNNYTDPAYPASYNVDNIVSVAAIAADGTLASFSNYGINSVHLAAPGVNILSYTHTGTESWSGTSMATPHVTGVAALLLSQDMNQDYLTLKQRLMASARPLASLRGKVVTGGLVNAYYGLTNQAAPQDPNDPFAWQKTMDTISTPHPYTDKFTQSWTLAVPGAKKISVHFSKFDTEARFDKVVFKLTDGTIVGTMHGNLGETFSPVFETDTVIMEFTTDDSMTKYGFDVDGIAFQ